MANKSSDAIRQLMPLQIDGDFNDDVEIEGAAIDDLLSRADELYLELFPDTCDETLPDWERVYELNPSPSESKALRRSRLVYAVRRRGGLSRRYFIGLAASLGYTATITEGHAVFRAGMSAAGDAVYTNQDRWSWTMVVSSIGANAVPQTQFESIITMLGPAHGAVLFTYP